MIALVSLFASANRSGAEAPEGRYLMTTDVVQDVQTGLSWQRTPPRTPATRRWSDALAYCNGLLLGGSSDWRVPTAKELSTLIDETVQMPAIDVNAFPNTVAGDYWSSTPNVIVNDNAWTVDFRDGTINSIVVTLGLSVRCVR